MNVIAVIPSRYGSTRFEGKPLYEIAGKPMIQRVYERAQESSMVNGVYVATDDNRIYDLVTSFGGRAIMTSSDLRSGTDRIAQAVDSLELDERDIVINIQGDQPHYSPVILDEVVRPLMDDPDIPMATLVNLMSDPLEINHPNFVKTVMDTHGFALYFSRSVVPYCRDANQNCAYWKHLGFYSYRRSFLSTFANLPTGELEELEKLEQLRALEYGYKIKAAVTKLDSIEVDTIQDAKRVERFIMEMEKEKALRP